jgi:hypothetical protein
MGATSVTGVGHGSAEGANKGSEHMSLGVNRLVGPRVIAAGSVTLAGYVATFSLPVASPNPGDYVVIATSVNSGFANPVAVTSFTIDGNQEAVISLKGGGATDMINFAVIKTGLA